MTVLDVALDRDKAILAVMDLALVAGAAFALALVSLLTDGPWITGALVLVWAVAAWVVHTLVVGTIARMSLVELTTGRRASSRGAVAFALEHLWAFALVPLVLVACFALVLAGEWLVLQVARLPEVGDVARAALFLPLVVTNVAVVAVAVLGLWLAPAAIAGEGRGTRAGVGRVLRAVARAPGWLIGRLAGTLLLAGLLALVLGGLVLLASSITLTLGAWAADPSAVPVRLAPPLSAFDVAVLADVTSASAASVVALLIYVLCWAGMIVVAVAVPLFVLPVAAACATWLEVPPVDTPPGADG